MGIRAHSGHLFYLIDTSLPRIKPLPIGAPSTAWLRFTARQKQGNFPNTLICESYCCAMYTPLAVLIRPTLWLAETARLFPGAVRVSDPRGGTLLK